jgi:hypothetical protein
VAPASQQRRIGVLIGVIDTDVAFLPAIGEVSFPWGNLNAILQVAGGATQPDIKFNNRVEKQRSNSWLIQR